MYIVTKNNNPKDEERYIARYVNHLITAVTDIEMLAIEGRAVVIVKDLEDLEALGLKASGLVRLV